MERGTMACSRVCVFSLYMCMCVCCVLCVRVCACVCVGVGVGGWVRVWVAVHAGVINDAMVGCALLRLRGRGGSSIGRGATACSQVCFSAGSSLACFRVGSMLICFSRARLCLFRSHGSRAWGFKSLSLTGAEANKRCLVCPTNIGFLVRVLLVVCEFLIVLSRKCYQGAVLCSHSCHSLS